MRIFWKHLIIFALISTSLSACGLKGDLYIPERQYPQPKQQ
ncbi:LPS translocon maturation chaperone LptM [Methylophilus aquaticus]